MKSFKTILPIVMVLYVDSASAQNIVVQNFSGLTANPVALTDTEVSELTGRVPRFDFDHSTYPLASAQAASPSRSPAAPAPTPIDGLADEIRRIARKLDAHVEEFLAGAPWKPFQQTLGISGYETAFAHPDETFYSLSIAVPFLPEQTAVRVRRFLQAELADHPPYAEAGYAFTTGRPRESYDVPDSLRRSGQGQARSLFGVYAFWASLHYAGLTNAAPLVTHWPAIRQRAEPLLQNEYRFDPRARADGQGKSEILNGDIAGLIGTIRLARGLQDSGTVTRAVKRCQQLLEARVNLDRVNPELIEPSRAASRSLHNSKLARGLRLVPELADALARRTDGCAAHNFRACREERNGWHLAYGDRLTGGENYTHPIHFPAALFAGLALIEQRPAPELLPLIDVPWCRGDFYFIQSCVYTLWAAGARPWEAANGPAPARGNVVP
jgi:hypothetical protein